MKAPILRDHKAIIGDSVSRGKAMPGISQSSIRSLLKQIIEKQLNNSKESRLQSCKELRKSIASLQALEDLQYDWKRLLLELSTLISVRTGSYDIKRAAARILGCLGALAHSRFIEFVEEMKRAYDRLPERADESRFLLILTFTDSLQALSERHIHLDDLAAEHIVNVCTNLLDTCDSTVVLPYILDLFVAFSNCFREEILDRALADFVDVCVGWIVNEESEETVKKCEQSLLVLQAPLLRNFPFLEDFVKNFLTDIRDGLQIMKISAPSLAEADKIHRTLRGLNLFLKIMSIDVINSSATIYIIVLEITKLCEESLLAEMPSAVVCKIYSGYILLFSEALPLLMGGQNRQSLAQIALVFRISQQCFSTGTDEQLEKCRESSEKTLLVEEDELKLKMARIVIDVLLTDKMMSNQLVITACQFFRKLCASSSEAVTATLCQWMSSPTTGILDSFVCRADATNVSREFSSLLAVLLHPQELTTLQLAYGAVSRMMKESLGIVCSSTAREAIVSSHSCRIIALLSALKHLVLIKNSIIVMMGIQPSIFHFLMRECRLDDVSLLRNQPQVHLAILHLAHQHCSAHDYFIESSALLSGDRLGNAMTAHNASIQLATCAQLLTRVEMVDELARSLVTKWLLAVCDGLPPAVFSRLPGSCPDMWSLSRALSASLTISPSPKLHSLLVRLESAQGVSTALEETKSLKNAIAVSDCEKRRSKLWRMVKPEAVIPSLLLASPTEDSIGLPLPSGVFSSQHFQDLFAFLLQGKPPTDALNIYADDESDDWMWSGSTVPAAPGGSMSMPAKWRRRIALAANYIVENRLKTTLGKPQQTLNAIHVEMQRLAREAIGGAAPSSVAGSVRQQLLRDSRSVRHGSSFLSLSEEWFRVRCLLELLEHIDRLLFNAIHGCMQPIASVSQACRQFFVMNEAVCSEWFSRVLPAAVAVAFSAGAYSQTIRFAGAVLTDLEKRSGQHVNGEKNGQPSLVALITIGWILRASVEMGAEQSVAGVAAWAQRVYPSGSFSWMLAARKAAQARYEEAISIIEKSLEENLHENVVKFLRELMVTCVVRLRSPVEARKVAWNEKDLERCRQLTFFGKIEQPTEMAIPSFNIAANWERIECSLLKTMTRRQVAELKNKTAAEGALCFLLDEDGMCSMQAGILQRIQTALHLRMERGRTEKSGDSLKVVRELLLDSCCESVSSPSHSMLECGRRLAQCRQQSEWAARLGVLPDPHHQLTIAKLARKTGNAATMRTHLDRIDLNFAPEARLLFELQMLKMEQLTLDSAQWECEKMRLPAHLSSLYDRHSYFEMEEALSGMVPSFPSPHSNMRESLSRAILHMADWLEPEETIAPFIPLCKFQMELDSHRSGWWGDEKAALAGIAISLSPQLAKAHRVFAEHAFKASSKSILATEEREGIYEQYEEPKFQLRTSMREDEVEGITRVFSTAHTLDSLAKTIKESSGKSLAAIDRLLGGPGACASIWTEQQRRKTEMLIRALNGYFRYLFEIGNSEKREQKSSAGIVSCTLRILHIIARHSASSANLREIILMGLASTNEMLWIDILPQVLARLSHPSKAVRSMLVSLLERIGLKAPHAICYQVIVGAQSREVSSEQLLEVDEETQSGSDTMLQSTERAAVFECCRSLEASLALHSPQLVADVRLFVKLLQSLNLMEERWAFVLAHLDSDMKGRLRNLKAERERTRKIKELSDEQKEEIIQQKTHLILDPVYRTLEDLLVRTQAEAKGPMASEDARRFISIYGVEITAAYKASHEVSQKMDLADEAALQRWAPFKKLCAFVMQRSLRRGGHTLLLSTIAPQLVDRPSGWCVPLPGQESKAASEYVVLYAVHNQALVLSTKTRPKKLSFLGNDGKTQTFLFKGHEDLHLDERTMQLLRVGNLLLSDHSNRQYPPYKARHYAVTPLGTLSGLIQWVGGATPLYSIYRRWQQREAVKAGNTSGTTDLSRPLELYHETLKSVFKANKVDERVLLNRRDWPVVHLREVLENMMKITPQNLISRELWLRSSGAAAWWRLTSTFARSVAVMCVMGSLLGLGDRHLDNLLLDFNDATLVHIDYNLCFEKGKNLRVPEMVPFRLTPNIIHALGVTKIEGIFRESCYTVLRKMRDSKELLSSLLEAFVYDPLVDWANGKDHLSSAVAGTIAFIVYEEEGTGEEGGRGAEAPVGLLMFSLRIREVKQLLINTLEKISEEFALWRAANENGLEMEKCVSFLNGEVFSSFKKIIIDLSPLFKAIAVTDKEFFMRVGYNFSHIMEATLKSISNEMASGKAPLDLDAQLTKVESAMKNIMEHLFGLAQKVEESIKNGRGLSKAVSKEVGEIYGCQLPPGFDDALMEQEQQNVLGASYAKKMISKVEGRVSEADPNKVITPEQQVDMLISEATDPHNLSLMYEGWTAWV